MGYNLDSFEKGLDELHISLTDLQKNQFIKYYELMVEWNKVMNLTAITDFEEVIEKHFLDSLCLNQILDLSKKYQILDLGTGAGFPGIPLKIAFPNLRIVLMDSLNKRINFLNVVIEELDLAKDHSFTEVPDIGSAIPNGILAVHGRAEEMARKKEYREQFDVCVSRAVANLSSLSEYCIPFVKKEGCFVSYKSSESDEELKEAKNAIFLLGGKVGDIKKYKVPGSDMGRSLIKINKVRNTPKSYPRKAGTPGKNPL